MATPEELIRAIVVSLLLQEPPMTVATREVVAPASHTINVPVIEPAFGNGLMVIVSKAASDPQLLVVVYVITAEPATRPVTTPLLLTVAFVGDELFQEPPATVSVNVIIAPPSHTLLNPDIGLMCGAGLTVIIIVSVEVLQTLVTV